MTRLARWLGIREGEGRLVGLVAALFAAIEAGRGFGEIGVDTLLINRFGAGVLPWLFIGLGLASLVGALAYGAALGRLRRGRLFVGLLLAIAAVLAVLRLAITATDSVLPVLWLTVYAAGAIAVTLTWTLAGSVLDARQAKRLFPICTSAAIGGSFAGTLLSGPVARTVGAPTLVVVEAVLFAVGAASVLAITRDAAGQRLRAVPTARPMAAELAAGFGYVRRSPLMRLVALAYLLFSVLAFSVQYPFLIAMSGAFPSEGDLATALGLLSAAVTATSFVVSLTIANRLFARFGVAGAALVLPVVYVVGFAAWLVSFGVATAALFRFAQQVTQRGVSNAAWSAFFNVVPGERRAQVLAFTDGVPGQLGIALSGVLLLAAGTLLAPDQVFWLGLVAAVLLTAAVVAIRRRYGESIVRTLRSGLGEQILEGGPGLASLAHEGGATGDLVAALGAPDPGVRRMAATVLGRVGARDAREALVRAVADVDAGVRTAALDALAALGAERSAGAGGALPDSVTAAFNDPDPGVRAAAVRAVSGLDGAAFAGVLAPDAARLAADPAPAVRAAVAAALIRAGEEERPHAILQRLLESPDAQDRIYGLEAVAALGGHSPSDRLPALLHDPSPDVRAAAVTALAATTDAGGRRDGVGPLLRALDDDELTVRRAAAVALRNRPGSTDGIVAVLDRGSPRAQIAALDALAGRADDDGPVRARLLAWAEQEVGRSRRLRRQHAALTADGPATTEGSRAFLASIVNRRSQEIEGRLLQAVAALGAPAATGPIRRCLRSRDPETRAQAIEALDSIGDRALGGAIVRLLEDEPDRRPGARDAAITELATDPDPWIRALALRARAESVADDWAAIHDRARGDADPIVRRALAPLLQRGGPPMPETVRTLDELDRMLFLRRVPLFERLSPEDLHRVAAAATERFFAADEALVVQGDVGDELIVLVEGSVRVLRVDVAGEEPRLVRRYGAGDHIGELAALRDAPRAATVLADEPGVRGLVIGGQGLQAILRERPEAAMAMLATLAERLSTA